MRIRAGSIALALLAIAGMAAGASAAPEDGLPRATVEVGRDSHRLHPWTATFATLQSDGTCVNGVSDGIPDWKPVEFVGGRRAGVRVVFHTSLEPDNVEVVYGVRLRNGEPRGFRKPPVQVSPTIRPNGEISSWVARFPVRVERRAFVDVSARWPASDGCVLGEGANWDFKLKRDRSRG